MRLPAQRSGRYLRFCSSVPPRKIDMDPIEVCAPTMFENAALVRPNCSSARQYPRSPAAAPPYSSGKGSPKKPSSPISRSTSGGILPLPSTCRSRGRRRAPAGTEDAAHLGRAPCEVAEVPDGESRDHGVEDRVGEGKRLGARDDVLETLTPGTSARALQHPAREVERDHRSRSGRRCREREIAGTRPDIEDAAPRDETSESAPAPRDVLPEREHPVQDVVAARDAVEHRSDLAVVVV